MLRTRREKWALCFALLLALLSVPRAYKLQSPDFKVFYVAARHALTDPVNLYRISPDRYLYPPSTALLFTPFGFSENYSLHQWSWHALLALLLFLLCRSSWAAFAAMLLLTRYLTITFGYGQVNLVVVALLAGAGRWLEKNPAAAGGFWALATSVKVFPAVFAPAFFGGPRGGWRGLRGLWVGALVGAGIALTPFVFFGWDLGWALYGEFLGALQSKGLPLHSNNQSFVAFFSRLFTDASFPLHAVWEVKWTLLALPPALVRGVALVIGILLALLSWKRARERGTEAYLAAAAFCILFLSHIVWKDYLLFLFFPLREIFSRWPVRRSWIFGSALLLLVTLSAHDAVGAQVSTRLDAACIHLWIAVLVWGAWWKK